MCMCVCVVTWPHDVHTHAHAMDTSCGHMFTVYSSVMTWPHDMNPHAHMSCGHVCVCIVTWPYGIMMPCGHVYALWHGCMMQTHMLTCHAAMCTRHDTATWQKCSCKHCVAVSWHIVQPCHNVSWHGNTVLLSALSKTSHHAVFVICCQPVDCNCWGPKTGLMSGMGI